METLFKSVKGQILKEDILEFNQEHYNDMNHHLDNISYDDALKILSSARVDQKYVKIIKKQLTPIHYLNDNGVCIPIVSLSPDMIMYMMLEKTILRRNGKLENLLNKKNYEEFFQHIATHSPQTLFYEFTKRIDDIPEKDRYGIFRSFHFRVEYGFEEMLRNGLDSIIRQQRGKYPRHHLKSLQRDDRGYVEIFRGVLSESTAPDKAYSWTTDMAVAARFATRFGKAGGKIFSAHVHPENISDFIEDRDEKEVIVLPEYLEDIKEVHQEKMEDTDFRTWMMDEYIIEDFDSLAEKLLEDKVFMFSKGLHDKKHAKRVLLLTLILSNKIGLPERDRMILSYCALYHDIGRTNDKKDDFHGKESVRKIKKEDFYSEILESEFSLEHKDIPLIEFIIEYHCVRDSMAMNYLKQNKINDERYSNLYKIFKDADALDRVRFNGLNPDMLRLKESKELISLAYQLQSQI